MSCQRSNEKTSRIVVLHGGVTFRDSRSSLEVCKRVMKASNGAVEAVENLEHSGSFNAGRGSSLTREGTVEIEAAVCAVDEEGELSFGGVGACSRVASPVRVAEALADSRREQQENGLIDPMVLVGEGVEKWATDNGMEVLEESFKSAESDKEWRKAMDLINGATSSVNDSMRAMDTVGAADLSLTDWSSTAACSSGGVILKRPGRLGHCTTFGAGVWVEQRDVQESDYRIRGSVSICLTGCGEAIVRLDAARSIGKKITERCPFTSLPEVIAAFYKASLHSENRLLKRVNPAHLFMGGVAIVREEKRRVEGGGGGGDESLAATQLEESTDEEDLEWLETLDLIVFHNTPFLPVAWKDERGKVRAMMSRREKETDGVTVTVFPL
ncbi:hypothetical protein PENTCL1PPCAC_25600 [Pristionchus entomophagus]|uniref:Asparaginase n=1 Tax=Pristionchus entomophagus TaxID=358040 RepID=A0AAV5UAD3_9BILA|nr:hypothetical protein PENTCL1PPCAC_25600 [Pristionchus entomophagus]